MEQIFFRMHVRVSRMLSRIAGGKTRIALETALFMAATTMLALMLVLHLNFVSPSGQAGCFAQYMPAALPPLIRVDIEPDPTWIHPMGQVLSRILNKQNRNSFVFAAHKGLMALLEYPNATDHTMPVVQVSIPLSSDCFGVKHFGHSPIWSVFLGKVVGFDTILINQFIALADGKGFLRNEFSKDTYNLNYASEFQSTTATIYSRAAFKVGVFFTILFLFFSTTTLVSFILRETQQRMLRFTLALQHHIRHRMPYVKLVFSHIIESLVFVPIMVRDPHSSKSHTMSSLGRHALLPLRVLQGSIVGIHGDVPCMALRTLLGHLRPHVALADVLSSSLSELLCDVSHLLFLLSIWLFIYCALDDDNVFVAGHALLPQSI
ncbi:hypothetical protein AC1031_007203 [Aphanomyces cochlioides]|nr:hypothetical protein AC1031_007203 [Aphanomyces cochlioides]